MIIKELEQEISETETQIQTLRQELPELENRRETLSDRLDQFEDKEKATEERVLRGDEQAANTLTVVQTQKKPIKQELEQVDQQIRCKQEELEALEYRLERVEDRLSREKRLQKAQNRLKEAEKAWMRTFEEVSEELEEGLSKLRALEQEWIQAQKGINTSKRALGQDAPPRVNWNPAWRGNNNYGYLAKARNLPNPPMAQTVIDLHKANTEDLQGYRHTDA